MYASWPLGLWLLEYIYALLSLGSFIFGIPGILSPILGPSVDPGVRLGASQPLNLLIDLGVVTLFPLLHLWRMLTPFSWSLHQWSPLRGW